MKKTLRGFGIGLFIAAACWTAYVEWFAPSTDEQIDLLEQQLKDSQEKVQHLQQQVEAEETNAPPQEEADKEESSKEQPEKTKEPVKEASKKEDAEKDKPKSVDAQKIDVGVVKGTIFIYDNVTLYDIGKQAEDAGILENGRELELYLYKPEYSRSIQKGQFELSSDMSLEEMALLLTGKTVQ